MKKKLLNWALLQFGKGSVIEINSRGYRFRGTWAWGSDNGTFAFKECLSHLKTTIDRKPLLCIIKLIFRFCISRELNKRMYDIALLFKDTDSAYLEIKISPQTLNFEWFAILKIYENVEKNTSNDFQYLMDWIEGNHLVRRASQ